MTSRCHRSVPAELDRRRGDGHAGPPRRPRHFPAAELVAVCKPYVAGRARRRAVVRRRHPVRQARPVRRSGCLAVARRLRASRPDAAVLFPNSFRSALLAWLGGCRRVVGFARYGRGSLLTDRLQPLRDARGRIRPSAGHRRLQPARRSAGLHRPRPPDGAVHHAGRRGRRGRTSGRGSASARFARGDRPSTPARRSARRSTGRPSTSPSWPGCSRSGGVRRAGAVRPGRARHWPAGSPPSSRQPARLPAE